MFTSAAEAGLVEAFTAGLKACSTQASEAAWRYSKGLKACSTRSMNAATSC